MTVQNKRNNQAIIEGEICSDFSYSHTIFGVNYFSVMLKASRLSQSIDLIPLLVSEHLVDVSHTYLGKYVRVSGPIRSYTENVNKKNHLILSLLVKDWMLIDSLDDNILNMIFLEGYICKKPVYRLTPFGKEITDVFLAVNRTFGDRSDYIPLILWGKLARIAGGLPIGDHIQIWGRFQSREYQKRVDQDHYKSYITYEVSVNDMKDCGSSDQKKQYSTNRYVAESNHRKLSYGKSGKTHKLG